MLEDPITSNTLKTFFAVFPLIISSFALGGPVIDFRDKQIIINQQADPFQLRQIINLNVNAGGIEKQRISSTRSTMKITPPFGLDENQTFPWASAEKVVLGLLHIKSGGIYFKSGKESLISRIRKLVELHQVSLVVGDVARNPGHQAGAVGTIDFQD